MKTWALWFVSIVLLVCLTSSPVQAGSIPPLPAAFYGALTINGQPAPAGTVIEARGTSIQTGIQGNPLVTSQVGAYGSSDRFGPKLVVQGDIVAGTVISFYINGAAATQTAAWGAGSVIQLNLSIGGTGDTLITTSVLLQGSQRPDSGWVVPLTVKFFNPGANVMTATPVYTFNLTTAKVGGYATAQCPGVAPGNYDVTAVSEHTLVNVKRNVTVTAPSTTVNLSPEIKYALLEGNANNDDRINILDFGILATSYGKSKGQPGYNPMADFDRNDVVNIFDFGLLATNYLKIAPIEVP
jgi:hypothetical protein